MKFRVVGSYGVIALFVSNCLISIKALVSVSTFSSLFFPAGENVKTFILSDAYFDKGTFWLSRLVGKRVLVK